MTDPFSIIGLLGVAAQFIQLAVDFGRDWKDVPEDTRALITKLQGLKAVLSVTHINILIDPDLHDKFLGRRAMNLSHPNIADPSTNTSEMVLSCKAGLEDLLGALKQCEKGHRVGWQRMKGAFNAKATRDRVEDLHHRCEILNDMVSINFQAATYSEVKATREEQRDWRQSGENKAVLAWLSGLSFEDTHRAVLTKRHPNTGQWFLNKYEFKRWRDSQSNTTSVLWCPGMPGAGKTVMSSVVIDHLRREFEDATIGIAFVYCDYKDRLNQTPSNLLSSLAKQLVRRKQVLPKEVKNLYDKHAKDETFPSLDEYSTLFSQLVASFSKTFIIVDGLDEHFGEEDDGSLNMVFINRLRQVEQQDDMNGRMRLFVTSRGNDTIRDHLDGCSSINIQALDSDIRALVTSRISDNSFRYSRVLRDQTELANTIVDTLAERAQGMFLLAHLHVDQLGRQTNIRDLRRTLDELPRPSRINSLYEAAITRINKQPEGDKNLALATLSWVVRARRPLLLSELLIALALRLDDNDLDKDAMPVDSLIASLTAGLLTMEPTFTGQDKTVRLAHFTVAEYFKDKGRQYLYTEDHLAKICLKYLLFKDMEPDRPMRQSDQRYGFYDYAANNWGHHVQAASTIDQDSVMRFLRNEDKAKACCTALNEYLNWPKSKGLYLTAYFQLEESMRTLIEEGCDINAANPNGWTLLLSFVERGQEAVVRFLLDNGAHINPRAKQGNITLREPLAIAAEQGNQTMVRLLLDRRADPNAEVQGGQEIREDRTVPLVNAAKNGHIEIVEMLLGTKGIRINEMVRGNTTAYYWAIRRRNRALARLLQSRGGTL